MKTPSNFRWLGDYVVMLLIWVALIFLFGAMSDHFLSGRTFLTLTTRIPPLTLMACGMTLVLIIGAIDLSVGSVLGVCGAMLGVALLDWGWPIVAAMGVAIAAGAVAGWLNGSISVRLGIPSFIVTLGMLEIARGLSFLATDSQTKYLGESVGGITEALPAIGVSPAFLISVVIVVALQLVLSRTIFGRHCIAIGTNENAVRLAGINPRPVKVAVFVILGALTGLAAVFYTARLGSSDPNAGTGMELSAIAAVVIGGTSLMGGRGSVVNSFFGVLIIATLEAGLAQVGVSEPLKRVITGSVIVIAVILDAWRHQVAGGPMVLLKRLLRR